VAAQLMLQGCGPTVTQVRRCVDEYGRLLPDNYCGSPYSYYPSGYGGIYYTGRPSYVYGGSGSFVYGSRVTGYTTTPSNGARVVDTHGTVINRGGFGNSSGSSGSFGG
jgi:uncharacterized protein YgiB involved in biofilm formation